MIKSMTGFGSAKGQSGKLLISVEVKSVNNRHFDCAVKLPRMFVFMEEALKSIAASSISRGKIDIFVYIDSSNADDIEVKVNHSLAEEYISALREIARENNLGGEINVTDLTRYPDILQATKREVDTKRLEADIGEILSKALSGFNQMRASEGEKLRADISSRLEEIERLTELVEKASPKTVADYREKLEARMKEVLQATDIDEARILTEAAIFADRVAVNEETVRLRSHVNQVRELLLKSEPVGRKIDFFAQEFNREANTIGSKCNDTQMSRVVVDLKAEIEKIREQAQNVE